MCGWTEKVRQVFFFQAEDGIRDHCVTGVQTCALPISQRIFAAAGDWAGVARVVNNIAILLYDQGNFAQAESMYHQALAAFPKRGNRFVLAAVLNNIGNALKQQGNLAAAKRMHGDALAIRREIGDKGGVAQSLLNIGTILYREGD